MARRLWRPRINWEEPPLNSRFCHSSIFRRAAIIMVALALSSLASSCGGNVKPGISQAAHDGDLERVKALLKSNTNLVFDTDMYDTTPLHYAASKDVAEVLLANGARVNARNKYGDTPLHFAATKGLKDVAEVLLANGADVNAVDRPIGMGAKGETPLAQAASGGHNDVVEVLRQHGGQ